MAEAGAPTEYLRDVHEAHCLFYGSNAALKLRVHVVVEALPVRTTADEYTALVQRVFGNRLAEYFDGLRRSAVLGASDTHDGIVIAAAAADAAGATAAPPP